MRSTSICLTAWRAAMLIGLLVAAAVPATAAPAALPAWEQLSQTQREQLITPIRERWNAEPAKRQRMLEHARRWHEMSPEQRKRAHHGMKRWQHMSPEQRQQMRALYSQMRGMAPEQRRALKSQWKQMSAEQRRAWAEANPPRPVPQENPPSP